MVEHLSPRGIPARAGDKRERSTKAEMKVHRFMFDGKACALLGLTKDGWSYDTEWFFSLVNSVLKLWHTTALYKDRREAP